MVKPTAENMHAFIQFIYDVFPEAGDELARSIGVKKYKTDNLMMLWVKQ